MKECCIVIPVYKENLSENELISFKKGIDTLRNYHISIISPAINLDNYTTILAEEKITNYSIDHFKNHYFKNIYGYNKLMMSIAFYKYYAKYKYILIYQLDAYVFKNELAYWCSKNYDYIGAPWFTRHESFESGDTLWRVGNGGFSLRKVQFFIDLLKRKQPIYGKNLIAEKNDLSKNKYLIQRFILSILYTLGYKNNIKYFLRHNDTQEDDFYMNLLSNSLIKFNCPTPEEGIKFAFERSPQYLYELNNKQLPFGCHAWEKHNYEFWKEFIV